MTPRFPRRLLGACGLLAALLSASPASAQAMKRFGGWLAACDNTRDCAAYSIARGSMHTYLRITREGAPSADAVMTLAIMTDKPYRILIEADDPGVELFPKGPTAADQIERDGHVRITREIAPDALVAAVRKARELGTYHVEKPADWSETRIDGVPFDGLLKALAWIDEQQKRSGTVTAFVRKGPKTVVAVPEPPAAPVVTAAPSVSAPAPKEAPPRILARADATCGKEQKESELASVVRLDERQLMYAFTCEFYSSSASQVQAHLIAAEDKPEAAAKPRFVLPRALARHVKRDELTKRRDTIYNPEFDAEKMELVSYGAYRGAGDCGELVRWVWTGREFQVAELRKMPDCEAIPSSDWPVLYRTTRK
jgi:hypothetical protein